MFKSRQDDKPLVDALANRPTVLLGLVASMSKSGSAGSREFIRGINKAFNDAREDIVDEISNDTKAKSEEELIGEYGEKLALRAIRLYAEVVVKTLASRLNDSKFDELKARALALPEGNDNNDDGRWRAINIIGSGLRKELADMDGGPSETAIDETGRVTRKENPER